MLQADELTVHLGHPVTSERLAVLQQLESCRLEWSEEGDTLEGVTYPALGIAMRFAEGALLSEGLSGGAAAEALPRVSAIAFAKHGFGGPGFTGVLPRGFDFAQVRERDRARLGAPAWSSPYMHIDRWEWGREYVTADYGPDGDTLVHLTAGILWGR